MVALFFINKSHTNFKIYESIFRIFLRSIIREHGILFNLKRDESNDTTAVAIEKIRKLMADPTVSIYFSMVSLKVASEV